MHYRACGYGTKGQQIDICRGLKYPTLYAIMRDGMIEKEGEKMKILFAADFCMREYKTYIGDEATDRLISEVKPYFEAADFSMVNLENVYNNGNFSEIVKHGPAISSVPETVYAMKSLGVDCVGMANNHAGDFGDEALFYTMKKLDENGISYIGAGKNTEAAYEAKVFEKDGVSVSVIAVCENEYGIAGRNKAGAAGFSLGRMADKIREEKERSDFVTVFFHGGNERNPFPSPEKNDLYKVLCDLGADAVVAMHTHCPQGWEMYGGKPIIYSMGNFFFPDKGSGENDTFRYGYMTEMEFAIGGINIKTVPYHFTDEKIEILTGKNAEKFNEYMNELRKPLGNRRELERLFEGWSTITGPVYAEMMKFPGNDASREELKDIKGISTCEAHTELLRTYFSVLFDGKVEEAKRCAEKIKRLMHIGI